MKKIALILVVVFFGFNVFAAADNTLVLKEKHGLTGVLISSTEGVIAVTQKANGNLQFVEITTDPAGQGELVKPITSEFPDSQLAYVGQKTKTVMMNPKYRRPRMQPVYNLSDTAVKMFVSGGLIEVGAVVTFGVFALVIDTVTIPIQLGMWARINNDFNRQNEALIEKTQLTSNSVIYLNTADYNQVKWALSIAQKLE